MVNLSEFSRVLAAPLLDAVVFVDEVLDGIQISPDDISIPTTTAKLSYCRYKSIVVVVTTAHHDIIDTFHQPVVSERNHEVKHLQIGMIKNKKSGR